MRRLTRTLALFCSQIGWVVCDATRRIRPVNLFSFLFLSGVAIETLAGRQLATPIGGSGCAGDTDLDLQLGRAPWRASIASAGLRCASAVVSISSASAFASGAATASSATATASSATATASGRAAAL